MANDLISLSNNSQFNFNGFPIRIEMIDGKPYFCGIDICNAISIKNNRNVIARLKYGVHIVDIIDNLGRKQGLSFVSEPNLYKIALQSRKPEAEPFVDWVCFDVLPTLRRTGCYSIAPGVDMKALGGLVKRCCRASIKECWVDVISGKPETMEAVKKTFKWMVKSNITETVREEIDLAVNDVLEKIFNPDPLKNKNVFQLYEVMQSMLNEALNDMLCSADVKDLENRKLKKALQNANKKLAKINQTATVIKLI